MKKDSCNNKPVIKIITITAVIIFSSIISGRAQNSPIDKGSINLGGDIRISSAGGELYETGNERFTTTEIKPYFGYFLFRQFSLGGSFLLLRNSQEDVSQTEWGMGPAVKYFIGDTVPKRMFQGTVYLYIEAGIFYNQLIKENGDEDSVSSGLGIGSGFGICYMLTNSAGLISGLSFKVKRMNSDGDTLYGNTLDLIFGFTFFIFDQN